MTCFMCHGSGSLNFDGLDFDDRELLAMTSLALHALALLLLEDDDLLAALVLEHLGGDRSAGKEGSANLKSLALAAGEDFVDFDSGAGFRLGIAVYDEDVALADRELLPLRFDSGFHKFKGAK